MTDNFVQAAGKLRERLEEAAEAHHAAEGRLPTHEWGDWYSAFITARLRCEGAVDAAATADAYVRAIVE